MNAITSHEDQLRLVRAMRETACGAIRSPNVVQDLRTAVAGISSSDDRRLYMTEEEFRAFADVLHQQEVANSAVNPATSEDIDAVDRGDIVVEYCVICMDGDEEEEVDGRTLGCGHTFHTECVDQWLRHNGVCPECREPIVDVTSDD